MTGSQLITSPASVASPSSAVEQHDVRGGGFLQRPFAQNVLPFVTSLSVHAAILILGLLAFGAYKYVRLPEVANQVVVADSTRDQDGPPGANQSVGLAELFHQQATQDKDPTASSIGWSPSNGPSADPSRAVDSASNVFDIGLISGLTSGTNKPGGTGGDGSGLLERFGAPNEGGRGLVFRDRSGPGGGNAHLIAYLCDGTGSMINKMSVLKDELNKSVVGLKPSQSFDIVFYQGIKVEQMAVSLIAATPENKRKAGTYLEGISAMDTTDPIPALITALKLKPQLLYFLTDAADFPDTNALLEAIKKYNPQNKIKINTILFVENKAEHDRNADSEGLMKKIASDSGGIFRWVEMDQFP